MHATPVQPHRACAAQITHQAPSSEGYCVLVVTDKVRYMLVEFYQDLTTVVLDSS